jgi:hypothetical protein
LRTQSSQWPRSVTRVNLIKGSETVNYALHSTPNGNW